MPKTKTNPPNKKIPDEIGEKEKSTLELDILPHLSLSIIDRNIKTENEQEDMNTTIS